MNHRLRIEGTGFLIIALSAALIVALAVLLPPSLRAWKVDREVTFESILREGVPGSAVLTNSEDEKGLAGDFLGFLERYGNADKYEDLDPWFFSALVIGYLRLHNVPLWESGVAALFSTQTRGIVTTGVGDSWQTLAAEYAGDEQLWPLLWLLNREWIEKRGTQLDAGYRIWVPLVDRLPTDQSEGE